MNLNLNLSWKNRNSLLKNYTNPYYTVYFKSYYQYFLQALTPASTHFQVRHL